MIQPDLRPLGIGEILDRAVNLFVRRFAVLILILALVAIPVAILQYAAEPSTTSLISDLQRVLSMPPGHSAEQLALLRQLTANNRIGGYGALLILVSGLLGALSNTACIIAAAQAYAGRLPSVREVYRLALRRWLPQLAAAIMFAVLAFVVTVGVLIVVLFAAFSLGALGAASRVTALIVGIPLALVALVVFFGVVILLYFAAQMTLVSIALEHPSPLRGIGTGLKRTLSPPLFWRSALAGTIVFGVAFIGSLLCLSVAATVSALAHLTALYPVIAVTGGVALNALITTFIVIYAFDVRVRREGYDLAVAVREVAL